MKTVLVEGKVLAKSIVEKIRLDALEFSVVNQDGEVIYGDPVHPQSLVLIPKLFLADDGSYLIENLNGSRTLVFKGRQIEDTKTFFIAKLKKYGVAGRLLLLFEIARREL